MTPIIKDNEATTTFAGSDLRSKSVFLLCFTADLLSDILANYEEDLPVKHVCSLLLGLLSLIPINAQPLPEKVRLTTDTESTLIASCLQDLEEQGYCVIPQVLSTAETDALYQRVWHEFIEKAWPNCRMHDRSNWKEVFPIHNKYGLFKGPAGQIQVMWDLRQDPRIVDVFAQVWNTNDLVVSMDGLSLMCPPEIRKGDFDPWPHVDQSIPKEQNSGEHRNCPPLGFDSESSLKTNPFTIQGQFLFEDSFEGDGGFYCIPKSHLRFDEFAPQLKEEANIESWTYNNKFLMNFFTYGKDELGNTYSMKHITAPRGSLILWDSRTVHWNQYPSENRPHNENPRVRMVGYLLYLPKARLTDEARRLRKEAFEKGVTTGAIPFSYSDLRHTKDHIDSKFERYLEDPSYTLPKVNLTPLGESLLGI